MKKNIILAFAAALTLAGCADLGFGVDVDSGGVGPYWYGNAYPGSGYWDTPTWGLGPVYNPVPPRPPIINVLPGPAMPPQRPQPPQRPEPPQNQRPPQASFPGINGISRPGNNGFPSPGQGTSTPAPETSGNVSNNARR